MSLRPPNTSARSRGEINALRSKTKDELYVAAKELQAPYDLVAEVAATGKLPVVLFTAGGVATPADAALMMQLGADGVFVGSGIFKSGNPEARAAAIVKATTFHDDPTVVAEASRGLGEAMVGINVRRPRGAASARRAWLVSPAPDPVGVLALQGDFREHLLVLGELGADAVPVRRESELDQVAGLVIPGGESSVMDKLSRLFGLAEPLKGRIAAGHAGLRHVRRTHHARRHRARRHRRPADRSAASISPCVATRSATRLDSFETDLDIPELGRPAGARGVHPRSGGGDRWESGPPRCRSLADGRVVAVEQGNLLGTSFHPEMTDDYRFHERFLDHVRAA